MRTVVLVATPKPGMPDLRWPSATARDCLNTAEFFLARRIVARDYGTTAEDWTLARAVAELRAELALILRSEETAYRIATLRKRRLA